MIDHEQLQRLNSLPISLMVAEKLRQEKQQINRSIAHLLQLVTYHLEQTNQQNLAETAFGLMLENQDWVMGLMVDDPEQMESEINQRPASAERILAEHLEALSRRMSKHESAKEVGEVLAENLESSLERVYPDLGT